VGDLVRNALYSLLRIEASSLGKRIMCFVGLGFRV